MKIYLRILLLVLCAAPLARAATAFDLHRDTFAFSNDTFWQYGVDEQGVLHITHRDKPVAFAHRCFVLTRAVLQFHQFARFDPRQPRVSREEYRRRIKRNMPHPGLGQGPKEKIVIPGYADLHDFSVAYEGLLKENLGNWLPSYLRLGNWRMVDGPLAGGPGRRRAMAGGLDRSRTIARHLPRALSAHESRGRRLCRAPRGPAAIISFTVYDPNYPNEPSWVFYRASERSFEFEPRWYFPGGRVNVMRVFISPLH